MKLIFAILNDRSLRRLRIETQAMDEIIQMFVNQKNGYIGEDFQCFQNRYVLTPKRKVISFMGNTYKKISDEKALMINDDIHAIYHEGKLYFKKFNLAKQIFDLSRFYTEATNNDIDATIGDNLFLGSDCEWMKANSDTVMRKLIKSIEDSGVISNIHPDNREFKKWVRKANIDPNFIQNGHIVLPQNKKQCKQILAFINEDIYEGIFSHNMYRSNSKHRN